MNYTSKKIEKKTYYNFFKKGCFSFSFLNFISKKRKGEYLKKYLLEVGLLKNK
jgi:hypothetical protein